MRLIYRLRQFRNRNQVLVTNDQKQGEDRHGEHRPQPSHPPHLCGNWEWHANLSWYRLGQHDFALLYEHGRGSHVEYSPEARAQATELAKLSRKYRRNDELARALFGRGLYVNENVLKAALVSVIDRAGFLDLQRAIEQVHVSESIGLYVIDLVASTRASNRVQVGASPRGTLAVTKLARAHAALRGRDFVTPEDVKAVAVPALAHRLMLRPELWVQSVRPEDVVRETLETVPTPAAEDVAARHG